jgi:hypothetical protein
MSSPQFFIYQTFLIYYLNPRNPDILYHTNIINYYYYDEKNKNNKLQSAILPNRYFIYNDINNNINVTIYIKIINQDEFLFIIPRQVGPDLFGNHFHIGKENKQLINQHRSKTFNRQIKNTNPIFLHWSLQDPIKQERNMFTKCTIRDGLTIGTGLEDLDDIDQILCTNRQNMLFKDEFNATYISGINPRVYNIIQGLSPHDLNLLAIIKHILRRPFYPLSAAGGAANQIFTGPRGGKYIVKNNKKIYLCK